MFSDPEKNINQFHIDPGMIVADFGSGSGHYCIALAKAVGPSGKVYAIDVQQDLLDRTKKQATELGFDNVNVIWADLEKKHSSGIKDGIVDRVVASNILFQIEDKEAFIDEIKRVLKPKGMVLVVDWTDSFCGLGPQPEHVIKIDAAQVMFESYGFKFEKEISVGDHHYGLIFRNI